MAMVDTWGRFYRQPYENRCLLFQMIGKKPFQPPTSSSQITCPQLQWYGDGWQLGSISTAIWEQMLVLPNDGPTTFSTTNLVIANSTGTCCVACMRGYKPIGSFRGLLFWLPKRPPPGGVPWEWQKALTSSTFSTISFKALSDLSETPLLRWFGFLDYYLYGKDDVDAALEVVVRVESYSFSLGDMAVISSPATMVNDDDDDDDLG